MRWILSSKEKKEIFALTFNNKNFHAEPARRKKSRRGRNRVPEPAERELKDYKRNAIFLRVPKNPSDLKMDHFLESSADIALA